jgi:hypothetical protein
MEGRKRFGSWVENPLDVEKVGNRLASNAESKALAVAGLNNQRTVNVSRSVSPNQRTAMDE